MTSKGARPQTSAGPLPTHALRHTSGHGRLCPTPPHLCISAHLVIPVASLVELLGLQDLRLRGDPVELLRLLLDADLLLALLLGGALQNRPQPRRSGSCAATHHGPHTTQSAPHQPLTHTTHAHT